MPTDNLPVRVEGRADGPDIHGARPVRRTDATLQPRVSDGLESDSAGAAAHDESVFALVESALFPTAADMIDVGTRTTEATLTTLAGRLNVDTVDSLERVPAATREMSDRGQYTLESARHTGSRRARGLQWHHLDVDKRARTDLKQHQPCVYG